MEMEYSIVRLRIEIMLCGSHKSLSDSVVLKLLYRGYVYNKPGLSLKGLTRFQRRCIISNQSINFCFPQANIHRYKRALYVQNLVAFM